MPSHACVERCSVCSSETPGGERDHLPVLLVVSEDRREVALREALSGCGRGERLIDLALPVEL